MIQAIAISDLHLGEDNSALQPRDNSNPHLPRLLQTWRALAAGRKIGALIILGDLMDLSLAYYSEAVPACKFFLQGIVAADLFDRIIYLPGNHDHHIWHYIIEQQFVFSKLNSRLVPDYPRTKSLWVEDRPDEDQDSAFVKSSFLNQLLPPGGSIRQVYVTYPNYLFQPNPSGPAVVLTHGHFFEREWTIISDLIGYVIGNITVDDLETFNAPLTEFLWYNLGQSERLSRVVEEIYQNAEQGRFEYLDNIIHLVMQAIDAMDGKIKDGYIRDHIEEAIEALIKKVLHAYLKRGAESTRASSMRNKPIGEISAKVRTYFENYLEAKIFNVGCRDYSIVFGHTHLPGREKIKINQKEVEVFNTGGWLLDENNQMPGAAYVTIQDNGQVGLNYFR